MQNSTIDELELNILRKIQDTERDIRTTFDTVRQLGVNYAKLSRENEELKKAIKSGTEETF